MTLLRGFVDEREASEDPSRAGVTVRGRDVAGRLVDDAADVRDYRDYDLVRLGTELASPWIPSVLLSNAQNRALTRGRGRRSTAAGEPIFSRRGDVQWRSMVGMPRADVLRFFLAQAQLLAWASADGVTLVIARPNKRQAPQYRLARGTILSADRSRSVADRHSEFIGLARPQRLNAAKLRATEADASGDFQRRKRAVRILGGARNQSELARLTRAEFLRAQQTADRLTVRVSCHGQRYASTDAETLYAIDTVARVDMRRLGIRVADYYVAGVTLQHRVGEDATELELLPLATEIVA